MNVAQNYIKHKYKLICLVVASTLIISGSLAYSKFYNELVLVKAQSTPTLTVSVEKYTQNHLPNITGNCVVGDNLLFTIKKGNTGVVSETIARTCTISPYSLTPTISLPDGKYKVSVSKVIGGCAINNTIEGTMGDDIIAGTPANDLINGNAGNDILNGGPGCDTIYAGNIINSSSPSSFMYGDGGNDTIYGGSFCEIGLPYLRNPNPIIELADTIINFGNIHANAEGSSCSQGFNYFNGTNSTLRGFEEKDLLIGSVEVRDSNNRVISGSSDYFELGFENCTKNNYYIGNGEEDFVTIKNFNTNSNDIIALVNTQMSPSIFTISFSNGVSSLYSDGDLIAKIDSVSALDITQGYFSMSSSCVE